MPTNEIARSTVLYVLVADADTNRFDYRTLLPAGNVQWGFAQKQDVFEAALRMQPWDVVVVESSMIEHIPADLLAAADFAEEGQLLILVIDADEIDELSQQGLFDLSAYIVKSGSANASLARELRRALYFQAMKQERSHLESEIARILNGWEQSVRDRTEKLQRRTQELLSLDELKTQFLANVSHELRTPMTLVRSYVELLLAHPPEQEEERADFLRIIDGETRRLSRMIDDLLDLTRLQSDNMAWKMKEVAIGDLVERIVRQMAPVLERENVPCETFVDDDLPPVWGDIDRLSQVLFNLLENAIKNSGGVGVRVSATLVSSQDGTEVHEYVQVAVEDGGEGIPADKLASIFDRFIQGAQGDARGAGLALAISQEIVTHHGGRIWAEPCERGVRFLYTIPLAGHFDVISGTFSAPDSNASLDSPAADVSDGKVGT